MRRRILMGMICAALAPVAARGQEKLARYAALLADLPGWEAEAAQTTAITQGGASYAWAQREYQRGEARVNAVLGTSPADQVAAATGGDQDMDMRHGPVHMRSRMHRGMRVVSAHNSEENSGMVLVKLRQAGQGGSFLMQYEGLKLDEATSLSERFDWGAMQKLVE